MGTAGVSDVSDVPGDVARAFAHGYRLERELGGGGMARVFVAHELTLGREVVLKVLRPDLAEALSAERFAKEIRLVARLQEPHIVPLLAAGITADGRPYYTMPFVAGQSLRARMNRGRIPAAEVMHILQDVLRALAYAHEHGIVHRDIKPENVLLSSGTAVVTDFGIAKALQASMAEVAASHPDNPESSGSRFLTLGGGIVGTAAYMAPEQATGDPATGRRADLYSWGIMAHELLSGSHPFETKASTQELLTAQITEMPAPLRVTTGELPSSLADLVRRCLAKDPADRPASAAEVLTSLEVARDHAITQHAVRHHSTSNAALLTRALWVYAASVLVVALAARWARTALGLPDWVLPGSLVVMALGLPVVLATGFVHRHDRPGGHRTAGRPLSPARQGFRGAVGTWAQSHLTWRQAAWRGVAMLGLFALGVAGYMALRALGIGPAGSLVAAGVLEQREPVVVADFYVVGPDTALGSVAAQAVRTTLSQSRSVSVVPVSRISAALTRMRRAPGGRLDASLAREVAEREGLRVVVGGDITPLGRGYVVTLRLTTAEGDVVAAFQSTAAGPDDLIPTLDGLTRALRRKIGESIKRVRADPPLEQVTTASLDALRKHTAAMRALNGAGDMGRAASLAREAIALDTTFAMAYRALAVALRESGLDRAGRDAAYARAYQLRDRLTEREGLLATADYFLFGPGRDRRRAAEAFEHLLDRDSTDAVALANLGILYGSRREYARAEAMYRRSIAVQPLFTSSVYTVAAQLGQGRVAAAESSAALVLLRFPDASRAPSAGVNVALARMQFDTARERAERWFASVLDPAARAAAAEHLAAIALVRGRLDDAGRLRATARALKLEAGDTPPAYGDALAAARVDLWVRGVPRRALERLDDALRARAPHALVGSADELDLLGVSALYAAAGQPERARNLIIVFQMTADSAGRRITRPAYAEALAEIALATGRPADAMAAWRDADVAADGWPSSGCAVCILPGLARAADRAMWKDSTRALLERYVTTTSMDRTATDQWFLPWAYRRLGELYGEAGQRRKAAAYDRRFLELWEGADPQLRPRVEAVRRHLAAMESPAAKQPMPVPLP